MKARSLRRVALINATFVALVLVPVPATGQMLVYDPSNYAQNVLQAARALQQVNNQITSLQNQTQMLLNQKVEERANSGDTLVQGRVREMQTGAKKILLCFLRTWSLAQVADISCKVPF